MARVDALCVRQAIGDLLFIACPGHIFEPAVTFITAARSSCGVTVQAKSEKGRTGPKDLKKRAKKMVK